MHLFVAVITKSVDLTFVSEGPEWPSEHMWYGICPSHLLATPASVFTLSSMRNGIIRSNF